MDNVKSHPTGVCGLKFTRTHAATTPPGRTPLGCVD